MNNGYELTLSDVPAFVEEEMMPPEEHESYYVAFFYRTKFEPSKYWKEEGKYWSKDAEKFMDKGDAIETVLPRVVATSDTPEQKVRKIYAFIGTLENSSFASPRSEQEDKTLGLKPTVSVQDVLQNRRGTRDQLTQLFVAMTRKAGVPAYLMRVANRTLTIFEPSILDWNQLDDDIAIVELNGQEVFLDPGTKYCPYGTLYWKLTASKGVRQTRDKGVELAETPTPNVAQAATKRVGRFRLTDEGELQGNLVVAYMGYPATSMRIEGSQTDATGRDKLLLDEVKSWLPSTAEVTISKQPQWDDPEKQFYAEFKVTTPALTSAGKRALLPLNVLQFGHKGTFTHAERQHSVLFKYPAREVDEFHIVLPASLAVESIPANVYVDLPYAIYKAERTRKDNEIVSIRDLAYAILIVTTDKYPEVKSFFDKVKDGDDQQGVLRSVANAAAGN